MPKTRSYFHKSKKETYMIYRQCRLNPKGIKDKMLTKHREKDTLISCVLISHSKWEITAEQALERIREIQIQYCN